MGFGRRRDGPHCCHLVSHRTKGVTRAEGDLRALGGACVAAEAAVLDALGAPGLADVEGQGLRVHGDVGRDAVIADAVVRQVIRVAVVGLGGHGGDAGLLQADERALRLLVLAPGGWACQCLL